MEFSHKVFLAESANGLITQYEVLDGNPNGHRHVEASLERHKETFANAPDPNLNFRQPNLTSE